MGCLSWFDGSGVIAESISRNQLPEMDLRRRCVYREGAHVDTSRRTSVLKPNRSRNLHEGDLHQLCARPDMSRGHGGESRSESLQYTSHPITMMSVRIGIQCSRIVLMTTPPSLPQP
ncbi:MAG: hypothetical protein JWM90_33, partial [Thermoleophilia bacterium]|nr:hypothetical protein [Thermoleophilia bacterium]